jgi:hypothetical protein
VTSSRYARDDEEETSGVGIALLVAASLLAGVLLILALMYAANFDGWRNVPKAPAEAAAPTDAQLAALGRSYLKIANPSNAQLNNEVTAFTASESNNLAAASSSLKAEVTTAGLFDRQLAAIKFPAAIEAIARDVIAANQARGRVIARQARAKTLARMQALNAQHQAADAAVEAQVKRLRQALHLPPPSTS